MSRTILITGVSSGIGAALGEHYLKKGHHVVGLSRRKPESLLGSERFRFASLDLTQHEQVSTTIHSLLNGLANLDLVILNAGVLGEIADMKDSSLSSLQNQMNVNVWANKTLLDCLLANVSVQQVVAISSGAAVNGNRGWNGYAISKAALNMLTQLYAAENPKCHFTALAPGLVDTAMQDYLCGQKQDQRFPSLETLKSKRGTEDMPTASELAPRLADVISLLPDHFPSGEFVDVRKLPEEFGKGMLDSNEMLSSSN